MLFCLAWEFYFTQHAKLKRILAAFRSCLDHFCAWLYLDLEVGQLAPKRYCVIKPKYEFTEHST
jgi:hypothetical protein